MKQLIKSYLIGSFIMFSVISTSHASDRVALLIANQDYRNGENDLKNPVNDANLIASKLKGLNFDVTVVKDGDRVAMHKAISTFGNDSKNAESAVFYYSGHGMQNKHHNNFLIPVDAKITDNDSINYTSVNVQDVIDKLDEANPKVSLVMLDACRNNKFLGTKGSRNFAVVKYKTESDGEMLVSYATKTGGVAMDGKGKNSPYAIAVANQLKNANDISAQLMFHNVREQVKKATNNNQNPETTIDIGYFTNLFGVIANNEEIKQTLYSINTSVATHTNLSSYAKSVNSITWTQGMKKNSAFTVKLKALLDWNHISPGPINDSWDKVGIRSLAAFQAMKKLPITGKMNYKTWELLNENVSDSELILMSYKITKDDVKENFIKIPISYKEKSKLDSLSYETMQEKLAEMFHMDIAYLKKLNKGKQFIEGDSITVFNPRNPLRNKITRLVANYDEHKLYAYNGNKLVASYPSIIGNTKSSPPLGTFKIINMEKNPYYSVNIDGDTYRIASGPNNPIGVVWLGLSNRRWGIHGTPYPELVDSFMKPPGSIKLTNWDALEIYYNVVNGAVVEIE